jgi:hypothetical protein
MNLFKIGDAPKGASAAALEDAKRRGATWLECFRVHLVKIYERHGFEVDEKAAMKWDDQYAPEGWDYGEYGRPDVVTMRLGGKRGRRKIRLS